MHSPSPPPSYTPSPSPSPPPSYNPSPLSSPLLVTPPNEPEVFSQEYFTKNGIQEHRHEHTEDERALNPPKKRSTGLWRNFPGYTKESIQNTLEMFHSQTTDFRELVNLGHYRDRTSVFDLTRRTRFLLFRTPSGHGKTSTLSMISYFHDVLHKDDFSSIFEDTDIGQRIHEDGEEWEHSAHLVLNLDFSGLDVTNFTTEVNKALQNFVIRYKSHFGEHDPSGYTDDACAAQTFRSIMLLQPVARTRIIVCIDSYDSPWWTAFDQQNRDEVQMAGTLISEFLNQLDSWNDYDSVDLVALAGKDNILNWIPASVANLLYDVVDQRGIHSREPMLGLTKKDILYLGGMLNNRYHSLGLGMSGKEYLDSEEGIDMWQSSGQYYGFSFRELHDYFHDRLEKASVGIEGRVPPLSVPLR